MHPAIDFGFKMKSPSLLFSLFLAIACSSQKTTIQQMEEKQQILSQLSKEQLIQRAKDIIFEDVGASIPDYFERRAYRKENEIVIQFYAPIHFAHMGEYYYHSAIVELQSESKSYLSLNNTEAYDPKLWAFYQHTPYKKNIIEKIILQITDYEETTRESLFPENYHMEILEDTHKIKVKIVTPNYMEQYQLRKDDFKVQNKTSRNHIRPTLDEQGFTEIH